MKEIKTNLLISLCVFYPTPGV